MTIDKQIEREAWEYSTYELARSGYIRGYNACLHSSRWRKVSEKLPELGVEVLVARNDGIRFLAWLDEDSELFFNVSGNEEYFLDEIQSWKPIDQEDEERISVF